MRSIKQKIIYLAVCLMVMLTCSAGCGTGKSNDQGKNSETPSIPGNQVVNEEGLTEVGFAQIGSESDWRLANSQSFRDTFTEENGYYLLFEDGQQKQENQLKAVRNFILQDVDYIVLDPIVETGWDSVLQEAKDEGIPVILADRQAEVEDEDLYTCWVGSDFRNEGIRAAVWLENYLDKQGMSDEEIHIVTLEGTVGSSAQIGRTEGFEEIAEHHPNWIMEANESGEFTQAKGAEVMTNYLEEFPEIDVVISQNDNMTFGAIDAIHEAGKEIGPGKDMIIISFDAVDSAIEAMKEGYIQADFECNSNTAPEVAKIIRKLEKGETVDKIQYVSETYYDYTMFE